jgi:hypothetical protein
MTGFNQTVSQVVSFFILYSAVVEYWQHDRILPNYSRKTAFTALNNQYPALRMNILQP